MMEKPILQKKAQKTSWHKRIEYFVIFAGINNAQVRPKKASVQGFFQKHLL